jgi:spore germination cell wall hydrolase CwlJ-like protein
MIPAGDPRWEKAIVVAQKALDGTLPNVVGKATNFFNPNIVAPPDWSARMTFVARVGNHDFYLDKRQLV